MFSGWCWAGGGLPPTPHQARLPASSLESSLLHIAPSVPASTPVAGPFFPPVPTGRRHPGHCAVPHLRGAAEGGGQPAGQVSTAWPAQHGPACRSMVQLKRTAPCQRSTGRQRGRRAGAVLSGADEPGPGTSVQGWPVHGDHHRHSARRPPVQSRTRRSEPTIQSPRHATPHHAPHPLRSLCCSMWAYLPYSMQAGPLPVTLVPLLYRCPAGGRTFRTACTWRGPARPSST